MENSKQSRGYRINIEKIIDTLPEVMSTNYIEEDNLNTTDPPEVNEAEINEAQDKFSSLTALMIYLPIIGGFFAYLSYYRRTYAAWPGWLPDWAINLLTLPSGPISPEPWPDIFATDIIPNLIIRLDVLYSSLSIFLNSLPGIR